MGEPIGISVNNLRHKQYSLCPADKTAQKNVKEEPNTSSEKFIQAVVEVAGWALITLNVCCTGPKTSTPETGIALTVRVVENQLKGLKFADTVNVAAETSGARPIINFTVVGKPNTFSEETRDQFKHRVDVGLALLRAASGKNIGLGPESVWTHNVQNVKRHPTESTRAVIKGSLEAQGRRKPPTRVKK